MITGTSPTLPAQAQADAAQAEATAEENKRAAEVLAEKLPNVDASADGRRSDNSTGANAPKALQLRPRSPTASLIDTTGQNLARRVCQECPTRDSPGRSLPFILIGTRREPRRPPLTCNPAPPALRDSSQQHASRRKA